MDIQLAVLFAVLLAWLAAPIACGPIPWHKPCGNSVRASTNTGKRGGRHGVTKLLKAVKTQIGIANTYFKNEKKNINITYHQVRELNEQLYRFDWLPQKQFEKYKISTCFMEKSARVKKVLQDFHSALQYFSVTFEELKNFKRPESYPETNARIRNRLINGIAEQLNQVLCEVESTLEGLNTTIPDRVQEDFLSKRQKWDPKPDGTGSLVQDWGVISLYSKFLGEWNLIIDRVNKKFACKNGDSGNKNKRKRKPKH